MRNPKERYQKLGHIIDPERSKIGYKVLYCGSPHTQYGVGIAISEAFHDAIQEVERFDDQLIKLTIISADLHRVCTTDVKKNAFWQLLDAKTCNLPANDYTIITVDLNSRWQQLAREKRV